MRSLSSAPKIASFTLDADSVIGWQLDTGIGITAIMPAGSIYPTVVDITKVAPRWTINHDDPTFLDAAKIPDNGIECTHANTIAFLQKRSPFGGLVAAATTAHIKVTAAGFAALYQALRRQRQRDRHGRSDDRMHRGRRRRAFNRDDRGRYQLGKLSHGQTIPIAAGRCRHAAVSLRRRRSGGRQPAAGCHENSPPVQPRHELSFSHRRHADHERSHRPPR